MKPKSTGPLSQTDLGSFFFKNTTCYSFYDRLYGRQVVYTPEKLKCVGNETAES